jgi:DNA mismatch endonuclease (patch repair protein)
MPSDPTGYWNQKIARNRARDAAVNEDLNCDGWKVIRVWEHVAVSESVELIESTLKAL